MQRCARRLLIAFLSLSVFGCASYKPIFDENNKFIESGKDQANQDFLNCKSRAEQQLEQYKLQKIKNEAQRKALVGSIIGGLSGLIFGNSTKSVVGGLVGGALFGGVYGGLSSYGQDKFTPDEMKQKLITRCLNNQGYEILGWY